MKCMDLVIFGTFFPIKTTFTQVTKCYAARRKEQNGGQKVGLRFDSRLWASETTEEVSKQAADIQCKIIQFFLLDITSSHLTIIKVTHPWACSSMMWETLFHPNPTNRLSYLLTFLCTTTYGSKSSSHCTYSQNGIMQLHKYNTNDLHLQKPKTIFIFIYTGHMKFYCKLLLFSSESKLL